MFTFSVSKHVTIVSRVALSMLGNGVPESNALFIVVNRNLFVVLRGKHGQMYRKVKVVIRRKKN